MAKREAAASLSLYLQRPRPWTWCLVSLDWSRAAGLTDFHGYKVDRKVPKLTLVGRLNISTVPLLVSFECFASAAHEKSALTVQFSAQTVIEQTKSHYNKCAMWFFKDTTYKCMIFSS